MPTAEPAAGLSGVSAESPAATVEQEEKTDVDQQPEEPDWGDKGDQMDGVEDRDANISNELKHIKYEAQAIIMQNCDHVSIGMLAFHCVMVSQATRAHPSVLTGFAPPLQCVE